MPETEMDIQRHILFNNDYGRLLPDADLPSVVKKLYCTYVVYTIACCLIFVLCMMYLNFRHVFSFLPAKVIYISLDSCLKMD